ncbi:hypothetical protein DWV00_31325 [Trinickia dinghuensis]|uniref:Uncharacterized protein n=2 Tax=Trinickia dinghuensis TaxID=2291023 RepID=A0A3D8JPL5_9BURK|nr:hypothetical protein DWV00_31325 [Trinickia dinghuensis]
MFMNLIPKPVQALLAALLTAFIVAPFLFLLPVPPTDRSALIALVVIFIVASCSARLYLKFAPLNQRALLGLLTMGAVLNVLTPIAFRLLPGALLDRMILDVIAPLFGLDGEYAHDAAGYELWWEIWLSLALIALSIRWVVRRTALSKA